MKRQLILVISLLCIIFSFNLKAIDIDTATFSSLIKSKSPEQKIHSYIKWAYYNKLVLGNTFKSDSLAKEALLLAHLNENNDLICFTSVVYSEVCLPEHYPNALTYLNEAFEIATKLKNQPYLFITQIKSTSININNGQYKNARESIQKAVNFFDENKSKKAYYYLALGDLQSKDNEKINSFDNYSKAIFISKDIENDSLLIQSYLRMFEFYMLNNNTIKAKENLTLASEVITKTNQPDKYDSLLVKSNLIEVYIRENINDFALSLADELLKYCEKTGYLSIKDRVFGTIRKYYLSTNNYKEICDLYCTKYPKELERLKNTDLTVFYRVNALIFENNQKIDSAIYFLKLAEERILQTSNDAGISNFYKRLGQFFIRQHDQTKALNSFKSAYDYSLKSDYFPYIIESASILDSMYYAQGNYTDAYFYAKKKYLYTDSNITMMQNDKFLEIEIENIAKLKELEIEKEELEQNRKSNFQVMIIVFGILLSLIILVLISSYKIPSSIIKGFGYITFVMLFEFIILILDTKIHHWAHGQPLKILAVKIVLIAIILPLHHATEHKVVHYLLKNRLISQGGHSIRSSFQQFKIWVADIFKPDKEIVEPSKPSQEIIEKH
jgi:hypothetical protein